MLKLILRPLFEQLKAPIASFFILFSHIYIKLNMEADTLFEKALEIPKGTWEINEEEVRVIYPTSSPILPLCLLC
jgi:hypothetical protein